MASRTRIKSATLLAGKGPHWMRIKKPRQPAKGWSFSSWLLNLGCTTFVWGICSRKSSWTPIIATLIPRSNCWPTGRHFNIPTTPSSGPIIYLPFRACAGRVQITSSCPSTLMAEKNWQPLRTSFLTPQGLKVDPESGDETSPPPKYFHLSAPWFFQQDSWRLCLAFYTKSQDDVKSYRVCCSPSWGALAPYFLSLDV